MSYLQRIRTIEGRQYRLHDDYLQKSTAKWEATKLRSKGWNVRLVKILGLWGVYKRRS